MSEILIGQADAPVLLRLDRANRHGVVAGATGTGKTVTLQVLAEGFSAAGVPVFAADVKGDLSGLAAAGAPNDKLLARAKAMGLTLDPHATPAIFWDLLGQAGHPIRATLSEMGPTLLSRLLELSDAQEGVLTIVFHLCDQQKLLLLDLDDLQAALSYVAENAKDIGTQYGNVAPATVGSIQRKLLQLRTDGADRFFGEPALDLSDLMRCAGDRGYVNVLDATRLIEQPGLYSTFLLWLMSELFEQLPEVGDPEKPKLVFFFDEAHLLFRDAPKALLDKIEQVVRLIRSKGVGIYFVTQNPADIPDAVLAQLGNRIQHALRAYTPADQAGLKAAAQSFRPNPAFDTAEAIQGLEVGQALISVLDEKGAPSVVARTMIRPPEGRIGPITPDERHAILAQSPVRGCYDTPENRESAYELLAARAQAKTDGPAATAEPSAAPSAPPRPGGAFGQDIGAMIFGGGRRQGLAEAMAKSVVRAAGSQVGRQLTNALVRGVLGSLTRR
ncbi:MAG TPA: helicase HerA-like domain-containing protein [Caulobacteraceae bacterium]|jgi:DNA helicase HerA-like ATPase|nr:helicase HerA-like domain-containing protein [Caulobacteraceae bacterium]